MKIEMWVYLFLCIKQTTICFYSSFLFLINVFFCILYKEYLYSSVFLCLFLTSIFFHFYKDQPFYLLDQTSILMCVIYGALLFLLKKKRITHSMLILFSFFMTLFLFYYGYLTEQFCYGPYGNEYHSILHALSSVGHLAILFM